VSGRWFARFMATIETARYDGTLRVVMWLDAFLSAAVTVLSVVASPLVAVLGLPHGVVLPLGFAALGCAVLLAGFGAVTFVLIGRRMAAGQYRLPAMLRLPLPSGMRPPQS
jgi:hypothetical protein